MREVPPGAVRRESRLVCGAVVSSGNQPSGRGERVRSRAGAGRARTHPRGEGMVSPQAELNCNAQVNQVADSSKRTSETALAALPITPFQSELLTLGPRSGVATASFEFEFTESISIDEVRRRCDRLLMSHPVYRSIVELDHDGMGRLRDGRIEDAPIEVVQDWPPKVQQYVDVSNGKPMANIMLGKKGERVIGRMCVHHAICDRFSMWLTATDLGRAEAAYSEVEFATFARSISLSTKFQAVDRPRELAQAVYRARVPLDRARRSAGIDSMSTCLARFVQVTRRIYQAKRLTVAVRDGPGQRSEFGAGPFVRLVDLPLGEIGPNGEGLGRTLAKALSKSASGGRLPPDGMPMAFNFTRAPARLPQGITVNPARILSSHALGAALRLDIEAHIDFLQLDLYVYPELISSAAANEVLQSFIYEIQSEPGQANTK